MVQSVKICKEIAVISNNQVGTLARIAQIFADRGINIVAISAQAAGGVALINVVVDDHLHARDLLAKKKIPFNENSVLLLEVEDKPGVLMQLTRDLAAKKIDLLNVYGSASATYGPCVLVLSTSQNQKALVALKKKMK